MLVTVFRRVPLPIIGTVGTTHDRAFEAFEERLDWLEAVGHLVERFDPNSAPAEVAAREPVRALLSTEGERCLPVILVNDAVVSRGVYPSRVELARAVGQAQAGVPLDVARQLAAIGAAAAIGFEGEVRRQAARARDIGIPEDSIRLAGETGAGMRNIAEPAQALSR